MVLAFLLEVVLLDAFRQELEVQSMVLDMIRQDWERGSKDLHNV